MEAGNDKRRGVTVRAILIGLALIPVNAAFVLHGYFFGQSRPATVSLFFNVVVSLLIVWLLNRLFACWRPGRALRHGELLTVYGMLSISTALCGLDQIQCMIPVVAYPHHYASPENRYEQLFLRDIPWWAAPSDEEALAAYHDLREPMWRAHTWRAWLATVGSWSLFTFLLMFVMLCVNALFRRQWTDEAKLSFPIVQLPLEMSRPEARFYRNKLMWAGFGVAFFVDLMRGLHVIWPQVPDLWGEAYRHDLGTMVRGLPWTAIGWTPLAVFPFGVGLAFLIPADLAFSCWFFYIVWKFVRIGTTALGWGHIPRAPWIDEQSFGAYMALCCFCVWADRRHLRDALLSALGRRRLDDAEEALPYRWALYGVVLGLAALVVWCLAAGMTFSAALTFLLIYLAISIAIARIRAELGSPVHDLHFTGPEVAMTNFVGPARLGKQNLVMFSFFWSFNRAHRSHPMPHQIEAMKLADETGSSQRRLSTALTLATAAGILLGWIILLNAAHTYGGARIRWKGLEAFSRLAGWLQAPPGPNWHAVAATFVGLAFTVFLAAMRTRFAWWPLHPAGFAVSGSWSMALFAPSIFVAWLIKTVLLRYAGMTSFRPATYFFYGLILGEFVAGAGWGILGIALQRPMYNFLP
ncbi:MAG: DUF6785 family protein [Armatimonadota bacterium]